MSEEIPYKPETRFAFVLEGTSTGWTDNLFTSAASARRFGGKLKGRVVKVEVTAVEVGPVVGEITPIPF